MKTYVCYSGHDPRLRDCVRSGGGLGKVTAILGMLERKTSAKNVGYPSKANMLDEKRL